MVVRIFAECRARTRKAVLSRGNVLASVVATAAAAVLAAGCATTPAVGAASSPPECTAADLTVTTGVTEAAAGHSSLVLLFTNSSGAPCFTKGYPGVAVRLPGGRVYNAVRTTTGYLGGDAAPSPARIQLAPGVTAAALIEWLHFPQDGSASVTAADCAGAGAVGLLVTAPDQATSTLLAPPGPLSPVCWGFEVHPIGAGSAGE